tara:strand:+ start:7033 stop:8313 length:1281 start_codon:yes stop_codon:yes gene_type:complete
MKDTLRNNNEIEILGKNGRLVTKETIRSGFSDEQKVFKIKGRVAKGKPTIIGSLKLTAAQNRKFLKAPNLKRNKSNNMLGLDSTLKMRKTGVDKDANNNIIAYSYDLIYTGKETTSKAKVLKYDLINNSSKIINKINGIDKIEVGKSLINSQGEKRKITIKGYPNTNFKLAINKVDFSVDNNNNYRVVDTFESSILKENVYNSTHNTHEKTIDIINGYLNKDGNFSFIQKFDKVTSLSRYNIRFYPSVVSRRFKPAGWFKGDRGWEDYYTKTFVQRINPTLTFRVTKTNSNYGINGGAVGVHTYDDLFTGSYRGNISARNPSTFTLTYVLQSNSAKTLTTSSGASGDDLSGTKGLPVFSNTDSSASDWTNSVSTTNGECHVDINNIAATGSGTTTYTLTLDVDIKNFGTRDTVMALDLDDVINVSA